MKKEIRLAKLQPKSTATGYQTIRAVKFSAPSLCISILKGGEGLRGIGEKFATDLVTKLGSIFYWSVQSTTASGKQACVLFMKGIEYGYHQ